MAGSQQEAIASWVGLTLIAEADVKVHKYAADLSPIIGTRAKGQIIGEVAKVLTPLMGSRSWPYLKIYTGMPDTFWYVPLKPAYFPDTYKAYELETAKKKSGYPPTLMVGGIVFTGYMAATSKNFLGKVLWGGCAALITGKMVVDGVRNIDLNPFD